MVISGDRGRGAGTVMNPRSRIRPDTERPILFEQRLVFDPANSEYLPTESNDNGENLFELTKQLVFRLWRSVSLFPYSNSCAPPTEQSIAGLKPVGTVNPVTQTVAVGMTGRHRLPRTKLNPRFWICSVVGPGGA